MSFRLLVGDQASILSSGSALIRRDALGSVRDAAALLEEAHAIRARADADAERIRDDARADGLAAARDDVHAGLAAAIAQMQNDFAAENKRRDADLAAGAFAAVRSILGSFTDGELAARLAQQAVVHAEAKGQDRATFVLEAHPETIAQLRTHWVDGGDVRMEPRADFAPLNLTLRTPSGRIVSDLAVQLGNLADRWGVADQPAQQQDAADA